jgi:predicted TPR repeat methyltransferase
MQLAIQLHQAGRLRKAEAIYQQILQIQPKHADALHLLGLANHQFGKHDQAFILIKQAISLNPGSAHFHNNLGEVCRALNRPDEALACYAKALALQPRFPEAHRNIGLVHLETGKPELAISHLRDALERFPNYLGIYWALGLALVSQHRADEAIGLYNRGLARAPADSALLCAKGIALKSTGRLEDTIEHYRHAIGLQPTVPELHHNLALAYQQQGETEKAVACLENELRLRPHDESARHLLAALQNATTERAPASYVRETFDGYAEDFDEHLVRKLEYRTPALLANILRNAIGSSPHPLTILDLGCGTGLFGEEVKNFKKKLVGIDLSPKMIDKARPRRLYDQLIVGDLLDYLAEAAPGEFDLIAATDVFIYVGNLLPVFEHVSRILAPRGWFVFSIEASPDQSADFMLDQTGRYKHHRDYLARLGSQFGFSQAAFSESCLRKEKDKPVAGYLYLLRKH